MSNHNIAIKINHVQISIPPGKEADARRFYGELFGLKELEKPENLKASGGLWLEIGDQQIHIGIESGVDRGRSKAHIAYEVSDLERWRDKLELAGVAIKESKFLPGYQRFEFRDPFGNRVEMMQRQD